MKLTATIDTYTLIRSQIIKVIIFYNKRSEFDNRTSRQTDKHIETDEHNQKRNFNVIGKAGNRTDDKKNYSCANSPRLYRLS